MITIWNLVRSDWHVMRILRLAAALLIGWQAWEVQNWGIAVLSVLILIQAITNTGCSGGSCPVPPGRKTS